MKRKNKLLAFILIIVMLLPLVPAAVLPASAIDDYPDKWKIPKRDTVLDDWGIWNRECVSWVLWCLKSRNGYNLDPKGRNWNAVNWKKNAISMGVRVDDTPAVGCVAWWDLSLTYKPGWGHTAWISEVNGDYITIEEYNVIPSGGGLYSTRVMHKSKPHAYLHFKDLKSTGKYYPPPKKNGDPIGDVLYSDITAYINGYPIPSSTIEGKLLVIVEDLANYGFDVIWSGAERTLKASRNKTKKITPLPVEKTAVESGAFKCVYVFTDIKTYLSGVEVASYSIDGRTLVDFDLLAKYGRLKWDDKKREIKLTLD